MAHSGKHKIADQWEDDAYTVLQQPNSDIPVYVVSKEDGTGPKRTLHRNLLLPIVFLPIDSVKIAPGVKPRRMPKLDPVEAQPVPQPEVAKDDSVNDNDDIFITTEHEETPSVHAGKPPKPTFTCVRKRQRNPQTQTQYRKRKTNKYLL